MVKISCKQLEVLAGLSLHIALEFDDNIDIRGLVKLRYITPFETSQRGFYKLTDDGKKLIGKVQEYASREASF